VGDIFWNHEKKLRRKKNLWDDGRDIKKEVGIARKDFAILSCLLLLLF
jgi:hypothetical protein